MRLWGLPVVDDTDREEPAATVGLNGSRDRRSLLDSLPGETRDGANLLLISKQHN